MKSRHLVGLALAAMSLGASIWAADLEAGTKPDAETVVVRQGNAVIRLIDVDAYAENIPAEQRGAFFADPQRVERVLRNMLANRQMANEARESGLDKDPLVAAQVQAASERVLATVRSDQLNAEYRRNVPDLEPLARERYTANPADFAVLKTIDVRHILISTKDRSEAEAEAKAKNLYEHLLKSPQDFDAYVMEYSDDNSKTANRGLIQNADSDRLVGEFRAAAATLTKDGEILPPVKTPYGFHIIQAVKITPSHTRSFAEAREELIAKLQKDYVSRKVQDHIDGLRGNELVPDMDIVKSLTTRYAEHPASSSSIAK